MFFKVVALDKNRLIGVAEARVKKPQLVGMEFVLINTPLGGATLGSSKEFNNPPHLTQISAYEIATTPMTNEAYLIIVNAYKNLFKLTGLPLAPVKFYGVEFQLYDHPVIGISWNHVQELFAILAYLNEAIPKNERDAILDPERGLLLKPSEINRLLYELGKKYPLFRLPTEAEWENATGDNSREDLDKIAVWKQESTQSVGTKNPNKNGLYDCAGNVCEWVMDLYSETYFNDLNGFCELLVNPLGPESSFYRVHRGGSFDSGNPSFLMSTHRNRSNPDSRSCFVGFRPVRTIPEG